MNKRKINSKKVNDIEELKEWQEHQYDPGYYTGQKIHPSLRNIGKPKLYGILIISMSLLFLAPLITIIVRSVNNRNTFKPENIFFFSIFVILFAAVLILQFFLGIKRIRKSTKKKKYRK